MCPLFFTIFKRQMYFSLTSEEVATPYSFSLPAVSRTFILSWLPRATRLLEASCLEKITVCVIGMLLTLPLVQMNKARREVNRTYKPSRSTNQDKHLERSSNFCYTLNPGEHIPLNIKSHEIFFKKYLLVGTFSSDN